MNRLRLRGIGLIESVLFVVIALGMLVGGIAYYQQTTKAARVNDAIRSIVGIQSGVRSLYQASGSFGSEGENLLPATIASGSVSPALVGEDGNSLNNQWAGAVTVRGYASGFVIDYGEVPSEACVRLAPHTAHGNGVAGSGIAAVSVNGRLVDTNADGRVSPDEASAACGDVIPETAMRWAFTPDVNVRMSVAQLEEMMGIEDPTEEPVIETGRTTETQSATCPEGFSGNQTRAREVIAFSDGTTVPGPWGSWDVSACQAPPEEIGRSTETETTVCPEGLTGTQSRSRQVIAYSNGSSVPSAWSDWDLSACVVAVIEIGRNTQTETAACASGFTGNQVRSREVISFSNGTSTQGAWSNWDASSCVAIVVVSTYQQTESAACDTNFSGQKTRTRTVSVYSDDSEVGGAWSSWNLAACTPTVLEQWVYKSDELVSCGASYTTRHYGTRKSRLANGSITSEARTVLSTESCPTSTSTRTVYHYSDCTNFGYQKRTKQDWRVTKNSNGTWSIAETAWVPSVSCAKF